MKSLLILLSTFLSLALVGCDIKEGTIIYDDIEFPRADSDEAQPPPPNVRLSTASSSFAENAGTVSISATLNKVSKSATTVTLSVSGSATEGIGQDFTIDSKNLVIPAGSLSSGTTLRGLDDSFVDSEETVTLSITGVSSEDRVSEDGDQQVTLTILDDDSATVLISDNTTVEDNGSVVVTLSLDNEVQNGFWVTVERTDGSATAAEGDYTSETDKVTFTGIPGETHSVSVSIGSDTKVEDNETLTLRLGSVSRSGIVITDTGMVTIQNDDTAAVTIDNVSVAENVAGGTATVTLSLDNAVQGGFAVDVSTSDGTATVAGSDYTAISGQTLSFVGNAGETETVTVTLNNDAIAEGDEALTLGMSNLASTSLSVGISDTGTLTITDDDATTLTIADVSVAEDSGPAVITLTSDKAVAGGFTVDVSTSDGSATTADGDYTALSSQTVSFTGTAGESQTVNIPLGADSKLENDETFSVSMSNSSKSALTTITDTATVTITNDDSATVTIADQTTAENSGSSVVTLSVDNAVQGGFTVDVSTSDGSATTADGDYTAVSSQIVSFTGNAGESQTVSIPLGGDTKLEADETLTLSLGSVSRSGITISDTTTVTVQNDDTAAVTIADVSVAENVAGGTATVTLRLDNAVQGGFRLDVATSNGTATAGSDYTAISGQTLSFAGTAGETETVTVTLNNDAIAEGDEALTLGMSNLALTSLPVTISDTGALTINDDDATTLTIADVSVAENSGQAVITLTSDKAVAGGFTVDVSTSDGSATTADGDYTALSSQTVTFAGTAGESQTVNIPLGADSKLENDETFSVSMSNSNKSALTTITDTATVTITNDDSATLTISDNTTAENSGPSVVTLSVDNPVQGGFWVTVQRADGTATVADSDYTAGTDNVSFTGTAGETQTLNIPLGSDTKVEDNETLTLSLGSVSRSGITISDTGTVTVQNDDSAAVTIDNVSVAENVAGGTATVTLRLDNAVQGGFAVDVSTSDGTATVAGSDYTAISGQTVSFAGTAGETETVTVTLNNDAIAEGDEALTLGMSNLASTSLSVTISDTGTLTINDDDGATVTIADVSVAEDIGPAVITLTSDKAVAGGFTVDVSTSDGSATTADGDYTALSSQTVTFAGTAGETQTVNIPLGADSKLENDETFSVSMSNSSKSALTTITDTATVTITNDDSATVTIADQTTAENSGSSVVTLSVDNAVQGGFTVDVSTSDGSATTADGDYTAVSSQIVSFTGNAGESQTVSIPLGGDTKLEADETLTLSLGSVSRSGITISDTTTVTIQNDDTAAVTIDNVSVAENVAGGTATVTLSLDNAVQGGFDVDVATSDGTATVAGSDYTAISGQTLSFAGTAGETETVTVTLNNDAIAEGDEALTLGMSNLASTSLSVGISDTGALTINDDDATTLTIADVSVAEDSGQAVITLTSDKAVAGGFTVDVSTSDGSATTADGDYTALSSQTVTFAGTAGESQTVNIPLGADSKLENDETFSVSMSNSNKSALTTITDTATVTITNDDSATVTIADQTTAENSGSSVVTLSVDNAVQGGFWVTVQRADGTATVADSDYTAGTDNVSFTGTAGETQTISIPLGSDTKLEADETLTLSLGSVSRSGITISDTGTVTVQNDDSAAVTIADVSVAENVAGGTATVTLTLDNAVQGGFAVDVATSDGTATVAGSDYTAISGQTLSFAGTAGETETVTVTLNNDAIAEGDEALTLGMSNLASTSLSVTISDTGALTINDDDGTTVTIADVSVAENSGQAVITLTSDKAVAGGFTVDVSTSDGSATTADGDYTALSSQTVTFAGTAGESQTVNIPLGGDSKLENDETLTVSMSNSNKSALTTITDTATVTITNDDSATVTISDNTTAENSGSSVVTLSVDNAVQGGFWVTVQRADGTATVADSDYTAGTDNVSFTGNAGETQTISIPLGSDTKLEADETLTLSMGSVSRSGITISDPGAVTVQNDDSAAVTIDNVSVAENVAGGTATVTLTLDNAVQGGFAVDVATSDGTATVAGSDYTAISGQTLSFAGTAGETETVTVTLNNDAIAEGDEALTLGMSNLASTSLSVTISDTGTLTINDDDGATVTIADVSVAENVAGGTATVTLSVDQAVAGGFTVDVSTSDGSATTADGDYTALSSQTVTFAGTAGESQTLNIPLGADSKLENDETFSVSMSNSNKSALTTITDTATVTITNDDSATLTIADNTTAENSGSSVVTLSVDNAVQGGFWVTVQRADGTATVADSDYTAGTDNVSFTGTAGETQTISIPLGGDTKLEANETLTLSMGSVSRSGITISDTGTVTVQNDDTAAVTIADVSVAENVAGGTATVMLTLDNAVQGGFRLDVATSNGTATAGSDYTALSGQQVTFAGTAGETQSVTVSLTNDASAEGDETLTLGMSNLASTSLSVTISDTGTLTINDDDGATVTIADVSVAENVAGGTATVTLSVDQAVAGGFTVDVSTSDGTATTGDSDYTALSSQTVTFTGNAGESQTVNIPLGADSKLENDETFSVSMSNSSKSALTTITDTATVTITNDDSATVTISDNTTAENSGSSVVTLSVDNAVQGGFWVTVQRADGTATVADSDYTAGTDNVSFTGTAGESQTVSIPLGGDTKLEANETLTLSLGSVSRSGITISDTGTVTVQNDDTAAVTIADVSVAENVAGGTATVMLTLDNAVQGGFRLDVATSNGTATAGSDYTALSGQQVTFAGTAGETQSVTVSLTNDASAEGDETLTLGMSNLASTSLSVTISDTGTLTINDDDGATVTIADVSVAENVAGGTATVTLSVDQAVAGGFTVDVSTSDGTATTGDSDYTALSSQTVTFTGNAGESQTVNIPLGADSKLENDETFSVSMSNSSKSALTTITDTATVTITNDDSATVTISDNTTAENSGSSVVTLSVDNAVQGGFWVTVQRADGTATLADSDYTAGTDNVSFTGTAGETQTISIPLGSDTKLEANETLTLSLGSVSRSGITISDTGTVTVQNDDSAAVTIADVSVAENVAGGTATVTLTLDNAVQGGFRLDVATSNGTATAGSDYTALSGQQVTFAGTVGETQSVTVSLTNDASAEGNETLTLSMSNLALTTLPVTISDTGTLTINDDEGAASVTIADNSSLENSGSLTFTLTLNAATASGFTVEYSKVDITAVGGSDYTASPNPDNVSFAGNVGETQTITVLLGADDQVEPDETFWIVLDQIYGISPSLVDISDNATGTIANDDSAAVTVANVSVSEGDSTTLTLALDNVVSGGFTVDVSTLSDNATSGTDYTAISSQSVSFSGTAGETETVSLTTIEDQVYEGNESLWIILSNSSNASVDVSDNASVTITDDDSAGFTLSKTTASVAETGTTDTFTVVLNSQPSVNVTLTLSDNDSSEVLYPSSVVFNTGNWSTAQTVTLTGKDDYVDDGNQSTLLTLTPSSGDGNYNSPTLSAQTVTVTTTDNDTAGFTISRTTADVSENGTSVTFTVVLNTEPTNIVEFDITSDDPGEASVSPGSLTFSTGNWTISQTVTITGEDDSDDDDNVTSTTSIAIDQPNTLDSVYDSVGVQTINVLTIDDEEMPIVTLSAAATTVAESGTVQITATQNRTAATNTTVNLSTTDGTTVGGDYTAPGAITITAGTLSGSINFAPVDDGIDEDDETLTIQISSVSGGQGAQAGTPQQVSMTINDDDTAGFTLSTTAVSVNESGTTSQTFTVVLDTEPTGDVVFDLSHNDATEATISPSSLTFTTGNWNTVKSVIVTAADELIDDGDVNSTVTASINTSSTADSKYDLLGSQTVTVTTVDNDISGITDFDLDNITRDIVRLRLGWDAPVGFPTDADDDYYKLFYTTVPPASRTPAGRMVDDSDNHTGAISGTTGEFIHGGLDPTLTYWYRLAAYIDDDDDGVDADDVFKLSTNELNGTPYPVECTSTASESVIADNDPDLLVYYPFDRDLNDYSPDNGSRANGYPYNLVDTSNSIAFGEGCAFGISAYFDGDLGKSSNSRNDGTYAENTSFKLDDIPDNWTLSLWVNPDGDMGKFHSAFASGDNSNGPDFQIDLNDRTNPSGGPLGRIRAYNNDGTTLEGPFLELNTWYHVALVRDANEQASFYVNGKHYETSTNKKPWYNNNKGRNMWRRIRVGLNRDGKKNWKGYIDEIKIFGRSFSADNILTLYQKSLPPVVENLKAISDGIGSSSITLTWDAVGVADNYTVYKLEQSSGGLSGVISFDQINMGNSVPGVITIPNVSSGCRSGTCSYTDSSGLVNNKYYYYRIAAVSAIGTGNVAPTAEKYAQAQ